MESRTKIVGVALLCLAFGSEALTLGRVRGAALIGRPLDLVVQVQMDASEDAASLCFDAEVFHADTRQDASRVRVLVEATAQPLMVNVRVLSSTVVDEPVVTVYLRTGCGQKTTRRYVLLADFPSEAAAPSVPLVAPSSAPASAKVDVSPAAPVSTVRAKTVRVPKPAIPREVDSKHPEVKAAVAAPQHAMSEKKSKSGRSAGQSRLKLDPLELLSDRVANLDSYMTFAPPEDALRSLQKMQALEGDVTALRTLAAKNDASLVDLKARLQRAEAERFPGGVIYGLIALVLACLAAMAFLWNRQRRVELGASAWWSGSIATQETPDSRVGQPSGLGTAATELDKALALEKARSAAVSRSENDAALSSAVDVSLMEMSHSNFDDLMRSGAAHSEHGNQPASPVAPQTGLGRSLDSAAILDVLQQAEFFVSLGQAERAVGILQKQINEADKPNPFVYLELFSLLHSLNLKLEFEQFREDFNRLFNGRVPKFAFFNDEGRSLESYPDVLSRIVAHWPTPQVLDVIEAGIFHDPQDSSGQSFDLAAFRDLLLLHAVAQSVVFVADPQRGEPRVGASASTVAPADTSPHFSDAGDMAPAPFPAPGRSVHVQPDVSLADTPLPRVLDLDLSDLPAVDVDLPLLMSADDEAEGRGGEATPSLDSGNLLNFDLPETPKRPGPAGH